MNHETQYAAKEYAEATRGHLAGESGNRLKAPSELGRIEIRLDTLAKRAHANIAQLYAVNNRLLGNRPEAVGEKTQGGVGDRAEPPQLRRIDERIDQLEQAFTFLESQIERTSQL